MAIFVHLRIIPVIRRIIIGIFLYICGKISIQDFHRMKQLPDNSISAYESDEYKCIIFINNEYLQKKKGGKSAGKSRSAAGRASDGISGKTDQSVAPVSLRSLTSISNS